jgi:hypothetical protein
MKLTKARLKALIESYIFEDEEKSESDEKYSFGSEINYSFKEVSGLNVIFRRHDDNGYGGVSIIVKQGDDPENKVSITSKDVEENSDSKTNFIKHASEILIGIEAESKETFKNIADKLNNLIDMRSVLSELGRSPMVSFNKKYVISDHGNARIA